MIDAHTRRASRENDESGAGPRRPPVAGHPPGSIRFDWAVVALSAWLIGGLHLDGWAHIHHPDLETFVTPWHGVLYAGFLALFLTLLFAFARNRGRGYPWRRALPRGYILSLLGGCVFLVGGVLDALWHVAFGIEVSTEALLSPTHLTLATGGVLLIAGPLRAAWLRPTGRVVPLAALLPALLTLTMITATLAFFTQFAHPQVDTFAALDPAATVVRGQLFAMRPDGTAQTRLLVEPDAQMADAAPSPDGARIAFDMARGGPRHIFAMNADGTGRAQLTSGANSDTAPAWSPDGTRIAFSAASGDRAQIVVMNADGSGEVALTQSPGENFLPTWSPDGSGIAFCSNRTGRWAVYRMGADGSALRRLTAGDAQDFFPAWSPDGRTIAFTSARDGHDELYAMGADGTDPRRLTAGTASNWQPAWSPDGARIAFYSDRDRGVDVFAMDADGARQTNLSRTPGSDEQGRLAWSPDGRTLLYATSNRGATPVWMTVNLGVASILLQAAILTMATLVALRRWALPLGSLTLVFGLTSALIGVLHDRYAFIPGAVLAGLLADLLAWRLRPAPSRPAALHGFAFAAPALGVALYFATLAATQGVRWTIHLWLGAIFMAGIVGLLLSYLVIPPAPSAEAVTGDGVGECAKRG